MYFLEAFKNIDLRDYLIQGRYSTFWVPYTDETPSRHPQSTKVLLLIVILLSFYACQERDYPEELDSIAARLTTIEQRIAQLEKMEQRITAYEFQLKELEAAIRRLYSLAAEAPEKETNKTQPEEKPSVRHHIVRSGDSLYGIAKEYGLTVAELRQLNNLTKDQVIYPGQELLIELKRTQ